MIINIPIWADTKRYPLRRVLAIIPLFLAINPFAHCQKDSSEAQASADFHYEKIKMWYRTNPDSTIVHAIKSLELYTDLKDTSKMSRCINALTSSYYRKGDVSTAANYGKKGYLLIREYSDASPRQQMTSLNNMAVMLQESGNSVEAIKQLNEVLKTLDYSETSPQSIAVVHQNIGNNYSIIGDYNRAQQHLLKALQLIDDSTHYPPIILSISSNAIRNGNYNYADSILNRLLAVSKSEHHEIIYQRLRAIISLYRGSYRATDSILSELLPNISNDNYKEKCLTLINLGKSNLKQNKPDGALKYFLQADSFISSNPQTTKIVYQIEALKGIASSYDNLNNTKLAEIYWSKAFTANRESGNKKSGISRHDLEWQLILDKVKESNTLGLEEKCKLLDNAIKHLLLSRMHLSTNESRMLHTSDSRHLFDLYIDLLHKRLQVGDNVFNHIIKVAQIAHQITLQENIATFENLSINPNLKKQFIEIQSKIKNIHRRYPDILDPQKMEGVPDEQRDSLQAYIEIKSSIEVSLLNESMTSAHFYDYKRHPTVQFIIFHEAVKYIYVMDNLSGPDVRRVPKRHVKNNLKALQNIWNTPTSIDSSFQILNSIRSSLLPDIAKLPSNIIYVISDGIMSTWPLDIFPVQMQGTSQSSSSSYLGEQYQFEYVNQLKPKIIGDEKKNVLSIAPTGFTGMEECNGSMLTPLKCNQLEAQFASNHFDGKMISDTTLSIQTLTEYIQDHNIIHLPTHICLDTSSWFNTQILLGDNSLNGSDLFKVDWSGKSVILSSCSSGQGRLVKGEGIISFSRWLLELGCSEILVSQWPIDDCVTSEIMAYVFEEWHKSNSLSNALFKARNRFIENAPDHMRTPDIWGAFVVIKNSPLKQHSTNTVLWYYTGAIILLILTLGIRKLHNRH